MADNEETTLEEALDNPREATLRLCATEKRTLAWPGLGMPAAHPNATATHS